VDLLKYNYLDDLDNLEHRQQKMRKKSRIGKKKIGLLHKNMGKMEYDRKLKVLLVGYLTHFDVVE